MPNDYNNYFYDKFIQGILYNDLVYEDVRKGKYDFYIFNTDFILEFINLIEYYIEVKILNQYMIDKIYTIISYIKNKATYEDENTKNYYNNIFNELILKLNIAKNTNEFLLYDNELKKRFNSLEGLFKFKRSNNELNRFIRESISFDFMFLIYHTDAIGEEDFGKEINELIHNEFYFASLNAILNEMPEIIQNKVFKNRVKKVIELNKKNKKMLSEKSVPNKVYILINNFKYSKKI